MNIGSFKGEMLSQEMRPGVYLECRVGVLQLCVWKGQTIGSYILSISTVITSILYQNKDAKCSYTLITVEMSSDLIVG